MNPLVQPAMGQIISLLFFYKDSFGIKEPTKVDMPLNKEIKPNLKFTTLFMRNVTFQRIRRMTKKWNNSSLVIKKRTGLD